MITNEIHLIAGQTFCGCDKIIHAHGPVNISGSSCVIYADNSDISGSSLVIRGNRNRICGSSNRIYGKDNIITGSSNVENGVEKKMVSHPVSMNSVFSQFNVLSNSHFEGKQLPLIGTLNQYGGTVNYQSSSRPVEVKTVITPTRPSEEELKNDEEADGGGEDSCVICFERKRKCVIRPCKHFSLCVTCSRKKLDECPICRVKITSIESLFT